MTIEHLVLFFLLFYGREKQVGIKGELDFLVQGITAHYDRKHLVTRSSLKTPLVFSFVLQRHDVGRAWPRLSFHVPT